MLLMLLILKTWRPMQEPKYAKPSHTNSGNIEPLSQSHVAFNRGLVVLDHEVEPATQKPRGPLPEKLDEATLDWFYRSPEYPSWKDSSCCAQLCLYGLPGSGKTTLLKHLLQTVTQRFDRGWEIASIFCTRSISSESCIVATLALQLLRKKHISQEAVFSILHDVGLASEGHWADRHIDAWWDLLEALTVGMPGRKAIILIDGVDELADRVRKAFLLDLNAFTKKLDNGNCYVRLLLSTRRYPDIEAALSGWPTVEPGKERKGAVQSVQSNECR